MPRTLLRDDQGDRIKEGLPGKATDCGVTAKDPRLRELACDVYALLAVGEERRVAADHRGDPP